MNNSVEKGNLAIYINTKKGYTIDLVSLLLQTDSNDKLAHVPKDIQ